jgi:hypothetical protein
VLASSPASLVVLPPSEIPPGPARVEVSCGKNAATSFTVVLVGLELIADSSPLTPGEHRTLTVRVSGSSSKVTLEARNLAPDISELAGGATVKAVSSGGADNTAHFELIGHKIGSFLISIRLVSVAGKPQ